MSNCPLGAQCHTLKDGQIVPCAWLVRLSGFDPSTGNPVDHEQCAIAALPTLMIQVAKESRATTVATEVFRESMLKLTHDPV